ncbi:hypothetical protein KPATCC21470_6251 [Kitasatospora purpeofusca]
MPGTLHVPGAGAGGLSRRTGATGPPTAGLGQCADTEPAPQPARSARNGVRSGAPP